MSTEDTSLPPLPRSYDAAFKELEDLSTRATKGEIGIDELSTAIKRGNQLFTFLSNGIAKIKAETEDHAPDSIAQANPRNTRCCRPPHPFTSLFGRRLTQPCQTTIRLSGS